MSIMPLLSHTLIDHIKQKEIQSVEDNREFAFLVCDGEYHDLPSEWDDGNLIVNDIDGLITSNCKGDAFLGHSHMVFTHKPSSDDFLLPSNNKIQGICVTGIDGIGCYDKEKQKIDDYKWDASFSKEFEQHGGMVWKGKEVYCDGNDDYFCEMVDDQHNPTLMGVFNRVTSVGGTQILHPNDADFSIKTHEKNEIVECYGRHGRDTLFCEVKHDE